MPRRLTRRYRGKAMALWTPDRITTALWLDADDAATLTLDGSGNVETWVDKSGNERDARQATASDRPAYSGGVLVFDGSSDFLETDLFDSALQQPISAFLVGQSNHGATTSTTFLDSQDETRVPRIAYSSSINNWIAGAGLTLTGDGGGLNEWNIHSNRFDSSNSEIWRNGVLTGTGDAGTDAMSGAYICRNTSGTQHLDGQVAEVVVIDGALDEQTRQKIEGYLAHKWGLAASLPAEHPYKDSAPIVLGLFDGTIADKDDNPAERRITVLDATGHCVATDNSDPVTGAYSIAVLAESPYTLVFDGEPDLNAQVFANVIPGESPA